MRKYQLAKVLLSHVDWSHVPVVLAAGVVPPLVAAPPPPPPHAAINAITIIAIHLAAITNPRFIILILLWR